MCFDSNLNKLAVKSILGNTGEQFEFGPCSEYNNAPLSSPKYSSPNSWYRRIWSYIEIGSSQM